MMIAKGLLLLRTVILCVCVKMFSVTGFYVMVFQLLISSSFYNNIFKVPELPKKPVQEEKAPILVKKKKDLPPAKGISSLNQMFLKSKVFCSRVHFNVM